MIRNLDREQLDFNDPNQRRLLESILAKSPIHRRRSRVLILAQRQRVGHCLRLSKVSESCIARPPALRSVPTAFAPKAWQGQLKNPDGSLDRTGYRFCVLDGLRRAVRRRNVFRFGRRYADPRRGLLAGAAWGAALPAICRTVGVSARPTRSSSNCRADSISHTEEQPEGAGEHSGDDRQHRSRSRPIRRAPGKDRRA
jgi:hypothetical protein